MKIERIRLFEVSLPLRHSFETSSHRKSDITHILVEVTAADGVVGWGEIATPSAPFFGPEFTDGAWVVATQFLAERALAAEWQHPDELDAAWAKLRGHGFAKAGFAGAAWDLYAKREGVSLATALGGSRSEVVAGVSLGIESSIEALLAQVQLQLDAGYGRVKLKIAPGWDVEPVAAVRAAHPDLALHVDANAVYELNDETLRLFRELDGFGLTMIEQPFGPRDFVSHQALQREIATPICLDESIVELDDIETMLSLDAGRVVNIKVSRMGGLSQARRAHDRCVAVGIPVWCGGMHEFGIGRAANIAASSLPGYTLPSDVSGSDKYYEHDIVDPPIVAVNGKVNVPQAPGLGFAVLTERIESIASRKWDSAG